jgi:hypothetical protein
LGTTASSTVGSPFIISSLWSFQTWCLHFYSAQQALLSSSVSSSFGRSFFSLSGTYCSGSLLKIKAPWMEGVIGWSTWCLSEGSSCRKRRSLILKGLSLSCYNRSKSWPSNRRLMQSW